MISFVSDAFIHCSCLLGESPIWDSSSSSVYWVDILGGSLHRFSLLKGIHEELDLGEPVCAAALCSEGQILLAFRRRLAVLEHFQKKQLSYKSEDLLDQKPNVRLNDGKVDPRGNFWIGSMTESGSEAHGVLLKVAADFEARVEATGVVVSNGMCWSPDNKIFYHVDTSRQAISAYDYDEISGSIKNRRRIIEIPKAWGKPDGMTIDEQGKLWIALWGGWAVTQWDPETGHCIGIIDLPVSQVTSCVFGGTDLSDLYITSARIGFEHEHNIEPLAGSLFKIKIPGVRGVPSFRFKL